MKTRSSIALAMLLAYIANLASPSLTSGGTDSTPKPVVQEDLGYDCYNGKTNKIVRISSVTPTHLCVIYEGGQAGRNIPRTELESPLREKYPYDAAKAAEFEKQNLDKSKALQAQQDQQRAAFSASLLRQAKALQSQIDAKNTELIALQKEIKAWRAKPRQPGRGVALNALLDKKVRLQKEIDSLTKQLEGVQNSQSMYR